MSTALKSCPFCGRPFKIVEVRDVNVRVHFSHDSVGCPLDEQTTQVIMLSYDEFAKRLNSRPVEDALRNELEEEKFARWQVEQALSVTQQEISELRALILYDLVGDADQLRQDMVGTIKERDQLRESVESQRKNIGIEIAKHAYTKSELEQAREALRQIKIAVDEDIRVDDYVGGAMYTIEAIARAALPNPPEQEE